MDKESKSEKQFAKGWSLFAASPSLRSFLRTPPTWFSAPVIVSGGLFIFGISSWLLLIFFSSIAELRNFATTGGKPETAEALKHIIAATGGVLGGLVATVLVVWRTLLTHRQTTIQDQTKELSERVHITTLISKAVEQLGANVEIKQKTHDVDRSGKSIETEIVRTAPNVAARMGIIPLTQV